MKTVTRKVPTLLKLVAMTILTPLVLQLGGCGVAQKMVGSRNPCAFDQTYFNGTCVAKPPAVVAQEQEWARQAAEAEARRLEYYYDAGRGGGGYGTGNYLRGYVPSYNLYQSGHGFHTHGHMRFYGGETYSY